jgi:hypothetical protein
VPALRLMIHCASSASDAPTRRPFTSRKVSIATVAELVARLRDRGADYRCVQLERIGELEVDRLVVSQPAFHGALSLAKLGRSRIVLGKDPQSLAVL